MKQKLNILYIYRRITLYLHRGMWEQPTGNPLIRLSVGTLRRIYLATHLFLREGMQYRASALTYSSILSLVPFLAIIFAVAKGFGLAEFTEEWMRSNIVAKPEIIDTLVGFVQSYLNHTQGGIFLGFGLLMLLYTLFNLTDSIESTFNQLWQVEKQRSVFRMLTDYTAVFFLLPIFMVITSGLTIFIYSAANTLVPDVFLLRPTALLMVKTLPYVVVSLFFTALFAFMPNTHVQFKSAIKSGFVTGTAFQILQIAYIHSQVWLTSYNAIYGSFAALPLFMLMCQISWMLTLYGGALCYVDQNLHQFYYGQDTVRMSRYNHDCLCIYIASAICKRFAQSLPPLTANELAESEKLHVRMVTDILSELTHTGIVTPITDGDKSRATCYVPSCDIHRITVTYLLETIDRSGGHIRCRQKEEWKTLSRIRKNIYQNQFDNVPLHLLP